MKEGRICKTPGCRTILNIYNLSSYCFRCRNKKLMEEAMKVSKAWHPISKPLKDKALLKSMIPKGCKSKIKKTKKGFELWIKER